MKIESIIILFGLIVQGCHLDAGKTFSKYVERGENVSIVEKGIVLATLAAAGVVICRACAHQSFRNQIIQKRTVQNSLSQKKTLKADQANQIQKNHKIIQTDQNQENNKIFQSQVTQTDLSGNVVAPPQTKPILKASAFDALQQMILQSSTSGEQDSFVSDNSCVSNNSCMSDTSNQSDDAAVAGRCGTVRFAPYVAYNTQVNSVVRHQPRNVVAAYAQSISHSSSFQEQDSILSHQQISPIKVSADDVDPHKNYGTTKGLFDEDAWQVEHAFKYTKIDGKWVLEE